MSIDPLCPYVACLCASDHKFLYLYVPMSILPYVPFQLYPYNSVICPFSFCHYLHLTLRSYVSPRIILWRYKLLINLYPSNSMFLSRYVPMLHVSDLSLFCVFVPISLCSYAPYFLILCRSDDYL